MSHYSFLTSAVDGVGGQRHASATLPLGKSLGTLCSRSWVVLLAGVDGYGEELYLYPTGFEPNRES